MFALTGLPDPILRIHQEVFSNLLVDLEDYIKEILISIFFLF
jgi:hypothetical protein